MINNGKYIEYFSKILLAAAVLFALQPVAEGQQLSAKYLGYIDKYHEIAVKHQQEYGIPASITLAQGLLESRAGQSYLATRGNNHFGIKCHNNWHGESVQYDDTLRHMCYRQYGTAEDSFLDHAKFLKGKRYSKLYDLDVTDYRAWARGLKDCGYAEDPDYPSKLVGIIERYRLFDYDINQPRLAHKEALEPDESIGHDPREPLDEGILRSMADLHNIHRRCNVNFVTAVPGDTYESIAAEFDLTPRKIAEFNDAEGRTVRLGEGDRVYIEPKNKKNLQGDEAYTVKKGETLWGISQKLTLRLKDLMKRNKMTTEDVVPGQVLKLR